jgi:hypothetical protein
MLLSTIILLVILYKFKKRQVESQKNKDEGNEHFGQGQYEQALNKYSDALMLCPLKQTRDRSIIYANRAACLMKMVRQK